MSTEDLIGEESRECQIIWSRPWHDDVWLRNPFSGEAFVVSKITLPVWMQTQLNNQTIAATQDQTSFQQQAVAIKP